MVIGESNMESELVTNPNNNKSATQIHKKGE